MKYILFFFVLIFADTLQAQDDRWVYLFESGRDDDFTLYYDSETLKRTSEYTEVWIHRAYNLYKTENGKEIDYTLIKERFYCDNRQMADIVGYVYYVNGDYREMKLYGVKDEVVPGSYGEKVWQFFCK